MSDGNDHYKRKLKINSITALTLQIATAISGIILPSLMIKTYGSAVNGLIASITQFLSYISLLETGIGGVVKAALYRPIAEKNMTKISSVLSACRRFFKRLSYIFLVYLLIIALVYPIFGKKGDFSFGFVFWLTIISGMLTFSQYYFCLTYQLLLQADQKIYVVNNLQTAALIINIVVTILLIKAGANILVLRLAFMLIFMIRPLAINIYVRKKYKIDYSAPCDNDAIKQRWDGMGHHVAYFIHKNTDIVILTVFSTFQEISVYSIFQSIIVAVQGIIISFSASVSAAFGNIYARDDKKELERLFSSYETFMFIVCTFVFSVTTVMLVPFISIYTAGVDDVSYSRPLFGALMVISEYMYTIRMPYSNLALAAGYFRDTRNGAFVEMGINIVLSLILVKPLGIVGVALGTVLAMTYRTFDFVHFLRSHILCRRYSYFVKNLALSAICFALIYVVGTKFIVPVFAMSNYAVWAVCAAAVSAFAAAVVLVSNLIVDRSCIKSAIGLFKR